MKQKNTPQRLQSVVPEHLSHIVLVAMFIACSLVVVLPQLRALHMVPVNYFNAMPIAGEGDADRDGIPDYLDVIPIEVERPNSVIEASSLVLQ